MVTTIKTPYDDVSGRFWLAKTFLKVGAFQVSYSDASTKNGPETRPLVFLPAISIRADIYLAHRWRVVVGG